MAGFGCVGALLSWAGQAPAQVPGPPQTAGPAPAQDREPVRRYRSDDEERGPSASPRRRRGLPPGFALGTSPWIDFSLTNFWLDRRSSNFLNIGAQFGGYFIERLRVAVRLVAPVEEAPDELYSSYYDDLNGTYVSNRSRSIAVLYGASLGLILSNSPTFVFAPGPLFIRTDVADYGNAAFLALPFEWTTARHLRVGFEFALGHAFGGRQSDGAGGTEGRRGGTALLLQFNMGGSLGQL